MGRHLSPHYGHVLLRSGDTLVWQLLIDRKIKAQNHVAGSHTSYKDCIIAFCDVDRRADTYGDHKSAKISWMDEKQNGLSYMGVELCYFHNTCSNQL